MCWKIIDQRIYCGNVKLHPTEQFCSPYLSFIKRKNIGMTIITLHFIMYYYWFYTLLLPLKLKKIKCRYYIEMFRFLLLMKYCIFFDSKYLDLKLSRTSHEIHVIFISSLVCGIFF